jgi:hypothetical protein
LLPAAVRTTPTATAAGNVNTLFLHMRAPPRWEIAI